MKTLYTKPGALAGALSLQQADQTLRNIFNNHFKKRPQLFVGMLLFVREKDYDIPQLHSAVGQCLIACPHQEVSIDKIKMFLQMKDQKQEQEPVLTDTHSIQIANCATQQLQAHQSLISQS